MIEIPFVPTELAFAAVWLLCRAAVWVRRKQIDRKREALLLLLYVDLAVLLRITFFPRLPVDGRVQPLLFDPAAVFPLRVNLIPFVRLADFRDRGNMLVNTIGNVGMFIPSGIILPVLYRRLDRFGKVVAAGALLSLCIELLQLPFIVRSSDVDALIMNTAGVAIGYGIYALFRRAARR